MIYGQGTKEQTEHGAVRESNKGRGRFDLLPYEALEAYAIWSEDGAVKYGDRNWERGLSVKDCINRLVRHAIKAANGWTDEDHLAACMWNAAAAITMMKRRPDCNDHPWLSTNMDEELINARMEEIYPTYDCKYCKKEVLLTPDMKRYWVPDGTNEVRAFSCPACGSQILINEAWKKANPAILNAKEIVGYTVGQDDGFVYLYTEGHEIPVCKIPKDKTTGLLSSVDEGSIKVKSALDKLDDEAIQDVLDMLIAEREFRKSTTKKGE